MNNELKNMLIRLISKEKRQIDGSNLCEIRLRSGSPVILRNLSREIYLDENGFISYNIGSAYLIRQRDIEDLFSYFCKNSIYAFEDEIKRGFITINGGNRIGIGGQVVVDDKNEIRTIKNISSLNIRLSHEIKGVAKPLIKYIYEGVRVDNTLIIAPPGCGKTTLLRDLIRLISNGNEYSKGKNVCVIDERCEIANTYLGLPTCDVGKRTDVIDACPKREGMIMAIRSMNPDVLAVDELGGDEDYEAIRFALVRGVGIIATIHGNSIDYVKEVFEKKGRVSFDRYVVLDKNKKGPFIEGIYEKNGDCIESFWRNSDIEREPRNGADYQKELVG